MKYALTEKEIAAIEKALNKGGATEVILKVEDKKVTLMSVEKKKIM